MTIKINKKNPIKKFITLLLILLNEYDKKAKIFTEKNWVLIDLQAGKSTLKQFLVLKVGKLILITQLMKKKKLKKCFLC